MGLGGFGGAGPEGPPNVTEGRAGQAPPLTGCSRPYSFGEPRRTLGEARRPGWGRFVRIAPCVVNCDATSSDHGGGLAAPGAARCGGSESTAGQSLRQPLGRLLVQPGRQELQRCEQRAGLRSTAGLPERPVPAVHGGLGVQLQ